MVRTWLDDPETAEVRYRPYLFGLIAIATLLGVFITKNIMEAVSAVMLVFIAIVCWRILRLRRRPAIAALRDPARVWALVSLGFAFLALDEVFSIHEKSDLLLHWLLSLDPTYLTDRIDDAVVVLYGIVGLIVLCWHRDEFRSLPGFVPHMAVGFFFLLVMAGFDVLSDSHRLLMRLTTPESFATVKRATAVTEEFAKLVGETAFALGFLRAYRHVAAQRQAAAAAGGPVAGPAAAPASPAKLR